jgi:murein DD-endopeptidase MepM/ murein hydrolase activator NlpD
LNKKKRFLVIPSKNKRIRYIRIRFSIIIIFIIILLGGVAGFFIPFSAFTLNVVELNQKKHLTEQNRKLLSKIRSMQEIFRALKSRVDTLDRMKSNIEDLIDIKELVEVIDTSFENELKNVSLDETLDYLKSVEAFYSNFINKIEKTNAYITEIPVIKPVIDEHVITARFSKMKDPFTGDLKDHKGIDFSAKRGTPVIATASGVVDLVENHKYWGNRIRIKHRYGFSSVYAHLGTVNVRMDQKVKKGDEIGTIGLSGLTIGPHLHYEIRRHGTLIDPENYFFPENISQLTAE